MTKAEAERGVRSLYHQWRAQAGLQLLDQTKLSFYQFLIWLRANHPAYLTFRTTTSVSDDVERWFEGEFQQTAWR